MAGKATFSAKADYSKTELQNLILKSMSDNNMFDGMFAETEAGGQLDKDKKIDCVIGRDRVQVKMDYRSMVNNTTAVEFAQLDLETQNYRHGHFMKPPKAGGVSERELIDNVDYIYYILPGFGVSIWEPATLSRFVFHLMRSMPLDIDPQLLHYDGVPLKGKNAFKIAVAANKEGDDNLWSSLNYLVPNEYMMQEDGIPLGQWSIEKFKDEETGVWYDQPVFYPELDDVDENIYIKPEKVIKWDDVLYALRIGDDFSRICELIAEHIYNYKYGKRKAFIIAENFDINTEFLKLYDWSSHKD